MNGPAIGNLDEFCAHALAIEREATERYRELAAQMQARHNLLVATFFSRMAELEQEHFDRLRRRFKGVKLPEINPWDYRWRDPESPESAPHEMVHGLMTAHRALHIALENERRAKAFFDELAADAADPAVRAAAAEFALEEAAHIDFVLARIENGAGPGERAAGPAAR